jgi:Protein of unknown function (DUF3631)
MIVGDHELDFLALWVVHTWAFEAAETTPYARIESAERSSGKTRLLEVLEPLVRRGLMVLIPTYSVVRAIDAECPTVLIDEIDQLDLNEQRELLAVMNAGFRLGPTVPRWNKERQELEHLDPFGPKCFAGLKKGRLPDTLISRSVPVELRRRLPTERVEPKFARDVEARAEPLAKAMKRWAEANHEKLAHAWPAFPEGLGDRECEVWLPLLNIADLVGGDWPKRAREAAVALSGNVEGEESRGVRLLTDIKDVFATQGDPDAIFSADLVEALNALEEASWGAWNNGEGMRQRDLAKILKPYAISPHEVRIGDAHKKGYRREQFVDAWSRYVREPTEGGTSATTATTATNRSREPNLFGDNRDMDADVADATATGNADVADENRSKEPNAADVADVADIGGPTSQGFTDADREFLDRVEKGHDEPEAF